MRRIGPQRSLRALGALLFAALITMIASAPPAAAQAPAAAAPPIDQAPAPAAKLQLDLSGLAAKASRVSEVTLDGQLLHQGIAYLSQEDLGDEDRALLTRLQGVYVRDYEFDAPGQVSSADLAPLRAQLRSWTRIVVTRDRDQHESTEIYMRLRSAGQIEGIAILALKPKELSVVNVVGPIQLSELSKLHHLGIPHLPPAKSPAPKPAKGN